jgi:hypothetical protein
MGIKSTLYDFLYLKPCRAYARHFVGDKPADAVYRFLCSLQFLRTYRFLPNFAHPRRFSEKVWSRQFYERDPKITMIMDKFRVRDYVAGKVGSDYLIPLLWNGVNPEDIPFDELPLKFVIKANHGCNYNVIVTDKTRLDQTEVKRQLKKWLGENYGNDTYLGTEWGYKNIRPTILIESFIGENGKPPEDYKFFCFSGRMEFFKIDFDRFEDHSAMYFDRELNGLGPIEVGFKKYSGLIDLPDNLWDMVSVAESLSEDFNFMRVDLYSVKNKIYFGELTPYPAGISQNFNPQSFDYIFGEKWK